MRSLQEDQVILRVWKPKFRWNFISLGWEFPFMKIRLPYYTGHVSLEIPYASQERLFYWRCIKNVGFGQSTFFIVNSPDPRGNQVYSPIFTLTSQGLFFSQMNKKLGPEDLVELDPSQGTLSDLWEKLTGDRNEKDGSGQLELLKSFELEIIFSCIRYPEKYQRNSLYISALSLKNGTVGFATNYLQDAIVVCGGNLADEAVVLLTLDKEKIEKCFLKIKNVHEQRRLRFSLFSVRSLVKMIYQDIFYGSRDGLRPSRVKFGLALGTALTVSTIGGFVFYSDLFYHFQNFLNDIFFSSLSYSVAIFLFTIFRFYTYCFSHESDTTDRICDEENGLRTSLLSIERQEFYIANCSKLVGDLMYYGGSSNLFDVSVLRWIGFRKSDYAFFCILSLLMAGNSFLIDTINHHDSQLIDILAHMASGGMVSLITLMVHCSVLFGAALFRYFAGYGTLTYPSKILEEALAYLKYESKPQIASMPENKSLLDGTTLYIKRSSKAIHYYTENMHKHHQKPGVIPICELGMAIPQGWSEIKMNKKQYTALKSALLDITSKKGCSDESYSGLVERRRERERWHQMEKERNEQLIAHSHTGGYVLKNPKQMTSSSRLFDLYKKISHNNAKYTVLGQNDVIELTSQSRS